LIKYKYIDEFYIIQLNLTTKALERSQGKSFIYSFQLCASHAIQYKIIYFIWSILSSLPTASTHFFFVLKYNQVICDSIYKNWKILFLPTKNNIEKYFLLHIDRKKIKVIFFITSMQEWTKKLNFFHISTWMSPEALKYG
jgi:hypothetical protein